MDPAQPTTERTHRPAAAPGATGSSPGVDPSRAVLIARGVRKSFQVGERTLEILHGVQMELYRGELLALTGPSGAGKSTLLHILGLLDRPTEGEVFLDGESTWDMTPAQQASLRNKKIGFVFQFYHLLPELTALENVMLPAMIAYSIPEYRAKRTEIQDQAEGLLNRFGLAQRLKHRPAQLSGGERQRVALGRALLMNPSVLIADEPTGNLDTGTGERVLELIFEEQARRELSLLLVTHDERLASRCPRAVYMEDGQIQADSGTPIPS